VFGWDRHLERWQVAHRAGFLNPVFEGLSHAGSYGAVWLVLAVVFAFALRRPQIFVWTLVADGLGFLLSEALKALFHRARPLAEALVTRPHSHSFPSGHATTSFACAATLARFVSPRVAVAFYVLAALVAWSRVYVGAHYPLDVLGGAALGLLIATALRPLPAILLRLLRAKRAG